MPVFSFLLKIILGCARVPTGPFKRKLFSPTEGVKKLRISDVSSKDMAVKYIYSSKYDAALRSLIKTSKVARQAVLDTTCKPISKEMLKCSKANIFGMSSPMTEDMIINFDLEVALRQIKSKVPTMYKLLMHMISGSGNINQ